MMHFGIANPWWQGKRSGIPGACATRKVAYLARGPCDIGCEWVIANILPTMHLFHNNTPLWNRSVRIGLHLFNDNTRPSGH